MYNSSEKAFTAARLSVNRRISGYLQISHRGKLLHSLAVSTTWTTMSTVFVGMTLRNLVVRYRHFRGICFMISEDIKVFSYEDRGSIFLRNVCVDPRTSRHHIPEDYNLIVTILDLLRVLGPFKNNTEVCANSEEL